MERTKLVIAAVLPRTSLERLEFLGPWSMADVLVVAVLVVAFKKFPGGSSIMPEAGWFLFLGSVLCAMLAVAFTKTYQAGLEPEPTELTRGGCSLPRPDIDSPLWRAGRGTDEAINLAEHLPIYHTAARREAILLLVTAGSLRLRPGRNGASGRRQR